jgi:2-(3-amino-3-carboxypropyl)histidine synthase
MDYLVDFEKIKGEIKKHKARRVLLQIPEGLKIYAIEWVKRLKEPGYELFVSSDPCWGACDIQTPEFIDLTIHFGHSQLVKTKKPVIYVAASAKLQLVPVLEKVADILPERVGLATTIQHVHMMNEAKEFLESKGKKVFIGKRDGQVLGCEFSAVEEIKNKVDAFLFIGSGLFHPTGIAYYCQKKTFRADPYTREVEEVDINLFLKRKYARIGKAKEAKVFGIIISTKPGQKNLKKAEQVRLELEEKGKEVYLIVGDEISPDRMLGFREIQAFVDTACPRIAVDDSANYPGPVLLPEEVSEL